MPEDYSGYGLVALREECELKGVSFTPKDTAEDLRKKLSPKPAASPASTG